MFSGGSSSAQLGRNHLDSPHRRVGLRASLLLLSSATALWTGLLLGLLRFGTRIRISRVPRDGDDYRPR